MSIKIIAFAGSLRKGSFNKKLVKLAASGAEDSGASVTVIDLKDYPMPIYDHVGFTGRYGRFAEPGSSSGFVKQFGGFSFA